jgi:hypothetical protein
MGANIGERFQIARASGFSIVVAKSPFHQLRVTAGPWQQQEENDYQEQEEGPNRPLMCGEGSLERGPKVEPMFPCDQPMLQPSK